MALKKPCRHGRVLCNLYGHTRTFAHRADQFATHYGKDLGQAAQALAPVATLAGGPTAGMITAGLGKGLETYAQVRNEMGN